MIKQIPEYPGYFADEDGNIWTNRPKNGVGNPTKELRMRKKSRHSKHCPYMVVPIKVNGIPHKPTVGYLVLTAFIGLRPNKRTQACHGVLGRQNDSLKNLCWGRPEKNNGEDKVRDGTQMFGEKNHAHKLNSLQVRIIRSGYGYRNKLFLTGIDFSRYFGVTETQVMRVVNRESWNHI